MMISTNDLLIAIAYFSIPIQIIFSLYRYPRLAQTSWHNHVLLVLFALFIFLCGAGHLLRSVGKHSGKLFDTINTATMIISVTTALYLVPIVPYIMGSVDSGLEELVKLNRELTESKKKLMTFMAFVCHELRNPLFAITATTSFLFDEELTPSQKASMNSIQQSANLMLRLVNDVLDIGKLESGKLELEVHTFDLFRLVRGVVTSTQSSIRKRCGDAVAFRGVVDSSCPCYIKADSVRILQIIYNLLDNSCKFTANGHIDLKVSASKVECDMECHPESQALTECDSALTGCGNRIDLKFVVSDTGCGIEQEKLKEIFMPYSQSKLSDYRKHGGTGLGLSILDKLIDVMGGSIHVESRVDFGSSFTVILPVEVDTHHPTASVDDGAEDDAIAKLASLLLSDNETAESRAPSRKDVSVLTGKIEVAPKQSLGMTDAQSTNSARPSKFIQFDFPEKGPIVLVVDDNAMNIKLIGRMLKCFGLNYVSAKNGKEGVEVFGEHLTDSIGPDIGLVIMDLSMPVMDGYTAIQEIRKRDTTTPIIALTANAMAEEKEKAIASGADEFCTKPILREALYEKCRKYLKQDPGQMV